MIIYAARILGSEHYGVFSYALGLTALFNIFSDIGLTGILTRELVKRTEKKEYLATSLAIKLSLVTATTLVIIFASPFFSRIAEAKPILIIMALLVAFDGIRNFLLSIFRAQNRMQFEAILEIITEIFITTAGFIVLFKIPSALNFSIGYLIASTLSLGLTLVFIRTNLNQIFKFFNKDLVWPILRSAWPFAIAGVFGVLMGSIDTVIIGWLLPVVSVGLYAAAQKPIAMLGIIPGFIYSSLFPFFSRFVHENDNDRLGQLTKKSILASLGLALPIVVGGIIMANPMIRVIYGTEYMGAVLTFQVLLFNLILVFPGTILSGILIAQDKQGIFIKTGAVGATINIILDLLLIPIYGIVGSAIATSAVQIVVYSIYFFEVRRTNALPIWADIRKILLATLIMALVTFYMKYLLLSIVLVIIVSGLLYFMLLFLFKEELINDVRSGFKR